jgi:PhzF family phenazine biosynthesis protein
MPPSVGSDARLPAARRFLELDVFGAEPFLGNPLAVIAEADGLSDEQMQRIASWTNLSETAFLLPPTRPEADYRVRIFTPTSELDFAGHPALGSARALLATRAAEEAADSGNLVQECRAGLVDLRVDREHIFFAAPPLRRSGPMEPEHLAAAARALRIAPEQIRDHAWVDNGAGWCVLELGSAQEVLDLDVDIPAIPGRKIGALGVVGEAPADEAEGGHAYEVRGFVAPVPASGTAGYEDPVTGSLNAGIAQWMLERERLSPPWTARQGARLGREGLIRVDVDEEGVLWVGGTARVVVDGEILA